ncbi:MAG TPA: hypothetical protein VGA08_01465 [Candidatus Saccharimonadales bacterium]
MQPYALTSQHQVLKRNQNTAKYTPISRRLGPISHALFVALMIVILGLMYLTQITKTTAFGYQVNDLQTKRAELVEENQQLEDEASRLQSLEAIRNSDVAKSLQSNGQIEFTQP